MPTGPATKSIDDQPLVSSSPLEVDPSPEVVRSNQLSLFRAQRPNIGARRWLHVKPYGSRGYWRIWAFPSRIWPSFTATTWVVYIWLGTWCSTRVQSTSKCTITSLARSGWRCWPSTHQHEPSDNRHLHQSLRSWQALAIHDRPQVDDPWPAKLWKFCITRRFHTTQEIPHNPKNSA